MHPRIWFVCGALLAGLAVVNGAYAAHGLDKYLDRIYGDNDELKYKRHDDYETGVRYQMYHAFGLMAVGLAAVRKSTPLWALAGFCFLAGILIFSGLLYLLVLWNQPKLGMIVPIGGVSFVIGWAALAAGGFGALREPDPPPAA